MKVSERRNRLVFAYVAIALAVVAYVSAYRLYQNAKARPNGVQELADSISRGF
jgi:hypothetical protein